MAKQCPDCGEHRWAASGYCLSLKCAGHYLDPDYPKTAPREEKWNTPAEKKAGRSRSSRPRRPRKGTLRSAELWFESRGETPPWKKDDEDHA